MIYIEKKSVANISPASGAVSDTKNVTDKVTNAPSIRLVEEMIDSIEVSGGVADAVDWENVQNKPINVSDFANDANYITESDVNTIVGNVIGAAPDALNTLEELANALGDDENFATTIATELGKKVDSDDVYKKEDTYSKNEINSIVSENGGSGGGLLTDSIIGWEEEEIPEGYEVLEDEEPQVPIGSGMDYYGISAPDKWMFADGSEISREEYSDLFAVIGTRFGEGNGTTTFNLPDKRERVSISTGSEDWYLGKTGGSISHSHTQSSWTGEVTLSEAQIPSHTHGIKYTNSTGGYVPASTALAHTIQLGSSIKGTNVGNGTITDRSGTYLTGTTAATFNANTGGGQPHAHSLGSTNSAYSLPPYLVCNYIIKVKK